MSLRENQLQVLSILSDNLSTQSPQLVPTTAIAEKTGIQMVQLQQLLKSMSGMGIIQADDDLQYNLITREGLLYLGEQHLHIPLEQSGT